MGNGEIPSEGEKRELMSERKETIGESVMITIGMWARDAWHGGCYRDEHEE